MHTSRLPAVPPIISVPVCVTPNLDPHLNKFEQVLSDGQGVEIPC